MHRIFALSFLLITILLAPVFQRAAQASEYSTVPLDSPFYTHLQTLSQAGWTGTLPTSDANALPLTRYEITLEAAKAIFAVQARHRAESAWSKNAPLAAVAALRELTASLRTDLQKLEIDVANTLSLLDEILAAPQNNTDLSAGGHNDVAALRPHQNLRPAQSTPSLGTPVRSTPSLSTPSAAGIAFNSMDALAATELFMAEAPISDRLRLHTALSTMERRPDPLDSTSWIANYESSPKVNSAPNVSGVTTDRAGASLSLTDWLHLRAQWSQRQQTEPPLLADLTMAGMRSQTALGGGVDIAIAPSLRLSGEMARVEPGESTLHPSGQYFSGTRLGGGVGLSAWQNRVVLNANLARLIPEDDGNSESTTAELNLGFNLTENLRLRLLYQQLFSPQAQTRAERIIAGGVSVQF